MRTPSLFVFPEGTTSNGQSILEFKNGAFENLSDITIFSFNYDSTPNPM